MVDSSLTFEEGEPIQIGTHGQHDFVYEGGEPVVDRGQSTLTFEEGTGLGGGGDMLFYWYGEDFTNFSGFSGMATEATTVLGSNAYERRAANVGLDEALAERTYAYVAVAFTGGVGAPDSADKSALSDWWTNTGSGLAFFSEANDNEVEERGTEAIDLVSAVLGSDGFSTTVIKPFGTQQGIACTTNGVPSGSDHPVFTGVDELARGDSEQGINGGVTEVGGTSTPVWAYLEETDGRRMWLDGGWVHISDDWIDACDDGRQYGRQVIEWLDGQI